MAASSPQIVRVSSLDEIALQPYRNLRDADLARLELGGGVPMEDGSGTFMAEGELVVRQLIRSELYRPASVLMTETRLRAMEEDLALLSPDVPVYVAPQDLMDEVVGYPIHRGVLAAGIRSAPVSPVELAERCSTLLVLEGLGNHDNVGAMFRIGAALGGERVGLLLDPTSCDPLYRKAIRVSVGHALHTPFARAQGWPDELGMLNKSGWRTVAMVTDPDAAPIERVRPASPGEKLAIVVGSEGDGMTARAVDACTDRVRIPMTGGVDSLNVFVAMAIALHRLRPIGVES